MIEYALQAFVSSLVMKLQLYVQQVNGALEETSQSVLSSLPRILRDTQLLQQETLALREKMVAVKQEIAKVGHVISLNIYLHVCNFTKQTLKHRSRKIQPLLWQRWRKLIG